MSPGHTSDDSALDVDLDALWHGQLFLGVNVLDAALVTWRVVVEEGLIGLYLHRGRFLGGGVGFVVAEIF